jgi:hypothetical protein
MREYLNNCAIQLVAGVFLLVFGVWILVHGAYDYVSRFITKYLREDIIESLS